jgi:hypothetical protein
MLTLELLSLYFFLAETCRYILLFPALACLDCLCTRSFHTW